MNRSSNRIEEISQDLIAKTDKVRVEALTPVSQTPVSAGHPPRQSQDVTQSEPPRDRPNHFSR
jgi:hypothetical protein